VQVTSPPPASPAPSQAGTLPVVLQPGDVIEAQVLALVDAGKVRIALANTIMEVATQVPLVPGTTVQLAVKGTGAELALVLVDKGTAPVGGSPGSPSPVPFTAVGGRAQGVTTTDAPTLQASIPVTDPEQAVGQPVRPAAAALAQAVRTAAAQQGGLAPLFADAAVAAESGTLPRPVQQAVARLLALQTPTAAPLTGADVKQAFVRSGLFLESSLGAAATVPGAARGAPTPAATGPGAPQRPSRSTSRRRCWCCGRSCRPGSTARRLRHRMARHPRLCRAPTLPCRTQRALRMPRSPRRERPRRSRRPRETPRPPPRFRAISQRRQRPAMLRSLQPFCATLRRSDRCCWQH
jgi:hypothetical protein